MGLQRLTFVKFINKKRMHPNKYDNPIHMLVCSSGYENMDYTTYIACSISISSLLVSLLEKIDIVFMVFDIRAIVWFGS
jgi:hypothetical protein